MRQVTQRQMPAGGPAFEERFALAGEVEIGEDFRMNINGATGAGQSKNTKAAAASSIAAILDRDPRPAGMPKAMALEDRPIEYADLQFIRDVVDLFGAGRLTNDKYKRGRLAGLAVCLYGDRIEVFGPMVDDLGLEPVGWFDDDLPPYGWRDEATDTLFRADPALIAYLAVEARPAWRVE